MSDRKIVNVISTKNVPQWGNEKKYIAVHYLGVVGQNHDLSADGCGAHFYIYWDGTIYQRCDLNAIVWAVGTAGYYTQKHPYARNANTISIEMCCKCDGDSRYADDKRWYFTKETQEACAWLVRKLMEENNIPADNVLRHYDIVNKTCPAPYVHNNKYRTSWTWTEFKAKLTDSGINIKGIQIGNLNVEAVSKVVYGEGGVFSGKNQDALIAIAQCMHDMLESGQYGKTLSAVLENNFYGISCKETDDNCRQAVYDVFVKGKRRFPEAKILQFRSYTRYTDGSGNMDPEKCADLLKKYRFLGQDGISNQWGHLYFGKNLSVKEYRVQAGSFMDKSNAEKLFRKIKKAGFDVIVKKMDGQWKVQCGVFEDKARAEALVKQLKDSGFSAILK